MNRQNQGRLSFPVEHVMAALDPIEVVTEVLKGSERICRSDITQSASAVWHRALLNGGAGVLRRGADAAGADLDADGEAVDDECLGLHVGLERAVGARRLTLPATGVLVADIVPEAGALLADVTFGHSCVLTFAEDEGRLIRLRRESW